MVYCCFSNLVRGPTYGSLQFFEPRVDKRVYEIGGTRKLEVDGTSSKVLLGGSKLEGMLLNDNQVVLYFLLIYF